MGKNYTMIAKTLYGMEDLLAEELRNLGASGIEKGVRSVSFEGDDGFLYKANLCCRTAIKILKPIRSFNVFGEQNLYDGLKEISWDRYMKDGGTLAVEAVVHSREFRNSHYVMLRAKDAIVDWFRDRTGNRPSIDRERPDLKVSVHIDRNICTVSLDSSGESLHKRGYRLEQVEAPINEVLAAGIILRSGWRGDTNLLDPMCGSGTLLIEAAMIAGNIPVNINRADFAFERWPDYDAELHQVIRNAALNKVTEPRVKIIGFDKSDLAVSKSKKNIVHGNMEEFIEIRKQNFFSSEKDWPGPLTIIFNPPYDERLPVSDVSEFYGKIGSTLKHNYAGSTAWMITAEMDGLKSVGLRPSRKIRLFNGKLDSRLVCYELYTGSKKTKHSLTS